MRLPQPPKFLNRGSRAAVAILIPGAVIAMNLCGPWAAAESDQVAAPGASEGPRPALSDPRSAAIAFTRAIQAGDAEAMRGASIGDGPGAKVVDALFDGASAARVWRAALVATFGPSTRPVDVAADSGVLLGEALVEQVSTSQIKRMGDAAVLVRKGDEPPIGGFWPNELVLRRVAGAWRVDVRSFELSPLRGGMAPDRAVFVLRKGAALAREETGRITAHEYKSAREAKDAIIRHLLESLRESDLATTRPTGGPN